MTFSQTFILFDESVFFFKSLDRVFVEIRKAGFFVMKFTKSLILPNVCLIPLELFHTKARKQSAIEMDNIVKTVTQSNICK